MKIYISGISGTGMGPLALMAKEAGHEVFGSDLAEGAIMPELIKAGIEVKIGKQDGSFLQEKIEKGVDWFVHTSALRAEHPELVLAKESKIKVSKRDDFTAYLVEQLGLKMIAVAGTHGKTTTTAMIVWGALRAEMPVSYLVGTTLKFAPSGAYHPGDKYFIYEADEYDRNFLKYHPWLAVIPSVSYDHPDIYPTREDYSDAFERFKAQSEKVLEYTGRGIKWKNTTVPALKPEDFDLAGEARKIDASLAGNALAEMFLDDSIQKHNVGGIIYTDEIVNDLNSFPGVGRRFERLADGVYTDYAHHPEEVKATIEMALEQAKIDNKKGLVVIYEPHQNTRQHEVKEGYKDAFVGADKIFWLPTYLTREDSKLAILSPEELIGGLTNRDCAESAEMSEDLEAKILDYARNNYLVLLMTAGPADTWFRKVVQKI